MHRKEERKPAMKIMAKRLWASAFVLLSSSGAANATLYPAETKNLRPDSAQDLCMDLSGDARLAKCNGSNAQKITLERRETGERRMRVGSQCVEGNREGEALFLAPCRSVVTQTWTYNNTGQIRNGNGLCVDVYQNRKTAGTPVITYRCNGTINQRWARYDVPRPEAPPSSASTMSFRPAHARDKCLDVTPEGRLVLWTCHGGQNQKFTFTYGRKSTIRSGAGCLTVVSPDAPVLLKSCGSGQHQSWTVEKSGRIVHASGACLDISMADRRDGTRVLSYRCTGQSNQRFIAIK